MFDDKTINGMYPSFQPDSPMCGGTRTSRSADAPTVIESHTMVCFSADSALGGMVCLNPTEAQKPRFGYVSAFAVAADGGGSFLFLHTRPVYQYNEPDSVSYALVKADIFPALDRLVRENDLAKRNGVHSHTNGLPQNFGGSVNILYESGEAIRFSNNQSPIFSPVFANALADLFAEAIGGEKMPLPPVERLRAIRFSEQYSDGGYVKATLTLDPDGTGINRKESCYEPGRVYESEKPVDAQTVAAIQKTVASCGMFAWEKLPRSQCTIGEEKAMVFVLDDGSEIAVTNQKELPMTLSGGFFKIELEMVTKH